MNKNLKYLITTNNWFYAPDGQSYRAAWGTVKAIQDDTILPNIKTNRHSSNWYLRVGYGHTHIIIAGCQVYYAVCCPKKPSCQNEIQHEIFEGKSNKIEYPSRIYIAE